MKMKKYEVTRSFVGHYYDLDTGQKITVSAGMGEVIEVPENLTDWEQAGLMRPVESAMMEAARPRARSGATIAKVGGAVAYADQLGALGIANLADLAAAPVKQLTTIPGVGRATAKRWKQEAQELLT
jgi:hypothetical protein